MLANKIKLGRDRLGINDMHVKTFLITGFPEKAIPGMLYVITHGEHTGPEIIINYSLHFKPSKLKFDFKMKSKLRRLQRNINTRQSGDIAETARSEEVKALDALLYLRGIQSGRYADVWLTVTISSDSAAAFKSSIDEFKSQMEFRDYTVNELELEQHRALDAAWLGGGGSTLFERYHGRVMDLDAVSALYPFVDGSISDGRGSYIGHRIKDATAVYKDFTYGSDNQNIIVVGSSDEGKSTWIKGVVISLLLEGYKVYIFDVDGEYYPLCKLVGGTWVDYTMGTGLYVDPTFIEPPILSEINGHSLDEERLVTARNADSARYNEAVTNTRATISLLCDDFSTKKKNALGRALTEMWEDAGIIKSSPDTWSSRKSEIGLHQLYRRIKENGQKGDEGAKELAEDLWTYFEGPDSDLFARAESGEWLKESQLVVFHVASSADNIVDQKMGAVKIVSTTHMTWQQIKRDRILGNHFSAEVFDEWQRLRKNPYARAPVYRSITTGRKFNDQAILGFNDPSVLFSQEDGQALWDNTKYKVLFRLEEKSIRRLAQDASMPDEVIQMWLSLPKYSFVFRQRNGGRDIYDVLKMELPESELQKISKTRGLKQGG
ncbi:hypothetical protein DFR58_12931 [Anaerobacterium chartisolvens]|uniref:TraG P-loop domain-containing protein n=1 Tax=Anaerobacterium chartisolvens TaxID=1297424 RepID=A0A369AM24_9FIRM|nr:hypothetical protein [Anaerobacterium chartisolvens]RCX10439.1 hypothetical protein DFR58_12931 [Anaerobacterium chartisolvens]